MQTDVDENPDIVDPKFRQIVKPIVPRRKASVLSNIDPNASAAQPQEVSWFYPEL